MTLAKTLQRGAIVFLVLTALLLGAAVAVPYFFKDKILAKVKTEANKLLDAKLSFADVNVSLLRSFPDFSFAMEELTIDGAGDFAGINLLRIENLDFTLDLMSVIKSDSPIEIHSIAINKPKINILVRKNGKANFDIVKPNKEESSADDFVVELKQYVINEGSLTFDDRGGDMFLEIVGLQHEGKGNFTQDVFDLVTKTSINQLTAVSGGIQYLGKAKTSLNAVFKIDLPNSTYTIADNELQVNAMKLLADGSVQMPAGDAAMIDLTFRAPQNDFKNLLSLVPHAFTSNFSDVKANGTIAFQGFVKGTYNSVTKQLPAFAINLDVNNGSFQYPDLPMGVDAITAKVIVNSPSSNVDRMSVNIPHFGFAIGGQPFEGRFKLTTPISDPNIDMRAKGTVDLADISKVFPLAGVNELSGTFEADMEAIASLSTIDQGDYQSVTMTGSAGLTNTTYAAEGLPKIIVADAKVDFSPTKVSVNNFAAKMGKSDVQASGHMDNFLAYFSPEQTMTGRFSIVSSYFNVNEWIDDGVREEETDTLPATDGKTTEVFDRFRFDFDARFAKIEYDIYTLDNTSTRGSFSPKELQVDQFATQIGKSDLSGKGSLTNVFPYVFDNEVLGGDLTVNSNFFDLNSFMEKQETAVAIPTKNKEEGLLEPVVVPRNINLEIAARVKELVYTNLNVKKFRAQLEAKDSKVKVKNASAQLLGGKLKASGFYETTNPKEPRYDLSYDIKDFDYKMVSDKIITIQKMAPITKYIQGEFSSTMSFQGTLGQDLAPDLNTLLAEGLVVTAKGFISGFGPLKKIGETLGIQKLKTNRISIKGTRNLFTVREGKVTVKEFPMKVDGITMLISGTHGIDQNINYKVTAKIPSQLIGSDAVNAAAQKGMSALNDQAAKLGMKLKADEFVNVLINLTGSIASPKVNLTLIGTDGRSAKSMVAQKVDDAKDTATTKVKNVVNDKKDELEARLKAKREELSAEADARIKRITDAAKLNANTVRTEGKRAAEKVRATGYKQADTLVAKAGRNIFKKKAANIAADKVRKETDKKAEQVVSKANQSAARIIKESEEQSAKIRSEYQQKMDAMTIENVDG